MLRLLYPPLTPVCFSEIYPEQEFVSGLGVDMCCGVRALHCFCLLFNRQVRGGC